MHDVGLIQKLSIDENALIHKLEVVAGQADDALHVVGVILIGIFEDDDVAALQRAIRKNFFIPRAVPAENKFVHQQVVANQERALHGS